jgi:hypothetical protein
VNMIPTFLYLGEEEGAGGGGISLRCCLEFQFWVFKEYSVFNHKKLSSKHLNACFDLC